MSGRHMVSKIFCVSMTLLDNALSNTVIKLVAMFSLTHANACLGMTAGVA